MAFFYVYYCFENEKTKKRFGFRDFCDDIYLDHQLCQQAAKKRQIANSNEDLNIQEVGRDKDPSRERLYESRAAECDFLLKG